MVTVYEQLPDPRAGLNWSVENLIFIRLLQKWNIFGCCCHCGLLLKILWRGSSRWAIVKKTRKNKIYLGFCRFGLFLLQFSQIVVPENLFCKCSFWTLVYNFSFQHLMYLIGGRLFKKLDEIVDFFGNRGWSIFFTKKQQKISYFDYFQGNLWFL